MHQSEIKTHSATDAGLIKHIILRDSEWQLAFTELFQRYEADIYRRCVGLLNSRTDAEDMVQEVFVRFYRFAHQYDGTSSLKTWLMRITENQCYTLLNRQRSQQVQMDHVRSLIDVQESARETGLAGGDMLSDSFKHLWQQLNPRVRDILLLRYWLDLTLPQIATVLGISLSASKMRLSRAQNNCKKILVNA